MSEFTEALDKLLRVATIEDVTNCIGTDCGMCSFCVRRDWKQELLAEFERQVQRKIALAINEIFGNEIKDQGFVPIEEKIPPGYKLKDPDPLGSPERNALLRKLLPRSWW